MLNFVQNIYFNAKLRAFQKFFLGVEGGGEVLSMKKKITLFGEAFAILKLFKTCSKQKKLGHHKTHLFKSKIKMLRFRKVRNQRKSVWFITL